MDGEGFDRFARSLGQHVDRRGAIGGMAAGLAALAGVAGRDDVAAKKKGKKSCSPPKTKCGKKCVDTDTDAKHCGDCDTQCAKDESCDAGACVGKCGKGKAQFKQDFEKDTSGWHGPIERVKSGTNGIDAASGKFFATVPGNPDIHVDTGVFTRWGEYSNVFPKDGYTTEIAIYLDPTSAPETATQFDYSSAINQPDCNHRRDFIFTVGVDTEAADPTFCVSASNNSPGFPCNPARDPARVTDTGWYVFRHVFSNDGNDVLSVDLTLLDPNGDEVNTWTLSEATDIIGDTVGGNRYGWFVDNQFEVLAIDDSKRKWS